MTRTARTTGMPSHHKPQSRRHHTGGAPQSWVARRISGRLGPAFQQLPAITPGPIPTLAAPVDLSVGRWADTRFADTMFADTMFADTRFADTRFADTRFGARRDLSWGPDDSLFFSRNPWCNLWLTTLASRLGFCWNR